MSETIVVPASSSNGVIEYSLWQDGEIIIDWQTSNKFENLESGEYTIKCRDEAGCTAERSLVIEAPFYTMPPWVNYHEKKATLVPDNDDLFQLSDINDSDNIVPFEEYDNLSIDYDEESDIDEYGYVGEFYIRADHQDIDGIIDAVNLSVTDGVIQNSWSDINIEGSSEGTLDIVFVDSDDNVYEIPSPWYWVWVNRYSATELQIEVTLYSQKYYETYGDFVKFKEDINVLKDLSIAYNEGSLGDVDVYFSVTPNEIPAPTDISAIVQEDDVYISVVHPYANIPAIAKYIVYDASDDSIIAESSESEISWVPDNFNDTVSIYAKAVLKDGTESEASNTIDVDTSADPLLAGAIEMRDSWSDGWEGTKPELVITDSTDTEVFRGTMEASDGGSKKIPFGWKYGEEYTAQITENSSEASWHAIVQGTEVASGTGEGPEYSVPPAPLTFNPSDPDLEAPVLPEDSSLTITVVESDDWDHETKVEFNLVSDDIDEELTYELWSIQKEYGDPIDTVEKIEAGSYKDETTTFPVEEGTGSFTYYMAYQDRWVNIIVKDKFGNKTAYSGGEYISPDPS